MKSMNNSENLCIINYAASVTGIAPLGIYLPPIAHSIKAEQGYYIADIYIKPLDKTPNMRHNYSNTIIFKGGHMKKEENKSKMEALKKCGALNPHADKVCDPLFLEEEFFDPNDLVQTKYEMLRSVAKDGKTVTEAAKEFGFSRLSFYRIQSAFDKDGLPGIVPQQRGPKQAHKLSAEVMDFMIDAVNKDKSLHARQLKELVKERFGLIVHHRSIERAFSNRLKKNRGE